MDRPGAHVGRLARGAPRCGLRFRTVAETPGRAAGVAATHAGADRRVSAAAGHRSRLRCRRRPGRRDGRCAPRYGRLRVVPQPRALDRISGQGARGAYAHSRDGVHARAEPGRRLSSRRRGCCHARCGLRAGGACRASVVVARAVRWAGVIPFSAAIAHPASMTGFNVSPSVTATVCSPRSEALLSESDCCRIAAILSGRHHTFGVPPHGPGVGAKSGARATRKAGFRSRRERAGESA